MSDVLSDEALEDLERKRQAATPGTWEVGIYEQVQTDDGEMVLPSVEGDEDNGGIISTANKQWVAAANPEAVGKLIAEVKANRTERSLTVFRIAPIPPERVAEVEAKMATLKTSGAMHALTLTPVQDEQDGLSIAAEYFEAMDASGDKEPLTPSAIACLLREYAADRRERATGQRAKS